MFTNILLSVLAIVAGMIYWVAADIKKDLRTYRQEWKKWEGIKHNAKR